jgi:hypothetical protein
MMLDQFAALAACTVLAGLAVFQGALISGASLGRFAWGGQHDVLPAGLRAGSAVSIVLYALFGYAAIASVGWAPSLVSGSFMAVSMWVLTAYFTLGVIMNGISRSRPERLIMTPTALVLAVLYLILAVG